MQDGLAKADVVEISRCGNSGRASEHALRDMHRLHERTFGESCPVTVLQLPLKINNVVQTVPVEIICPFELLHCIYTEGDFARSMQTSDISFRQYWEVFLQQEDAKDHRLQNRSDLWDWAVPVRWFADGAEFSKSSAVEGIIYQWSSAICWGLSSMWLKHLCAFLVSDEFCDETNDALVSYFAYVHDILFRGEMPYTDYYGHGHPQNTWRAQRQGRRICGPYIACFANVAHDEVFRRKTHKFRYNFKANYICESDCACQHIPGLSFTNFRLDALWRTARISQAQYLEKWDKTDHSPWLKIEDFHIARALHDWMHSTHLGSGRDVIAESYRELCDFDYIEGSTYNEKLANYQSKYNIWCKAHSITPSKRKWTTKTLGFPEPYTYKCAELDGRTKAAHIKPILKFLSEQCLKAAENPNPKDVMAKVRATMVWGLVDTMHVFDHAGAFLELFEIHF